ncbi:glycosyltransferase [Gordonia jacobaea]|uniref:glycosyltransferase n=1 Tax=Gordonia TaxID=2053 RepID=UPI003A4D592F
MSAVPRESSVQWCYRFSLIRGGSVLNVSQRDPVVSIVIVGYNSGHLIQEAVKPFLGDPRVEFILVDNASSDDTLSQFASIGSGSPSVIVERSNNGGFAVAVNEGVERASAPFVLLLNPDASLSLQDLFLLVSDFDSEQSAIVGPMVGEQNAPTTTAGYYPSVWRMAMHATGLSRLGGFVPVFRGHYILRNDVLGEVRAVDWVTGGCMLVRRDTWNRMNGLSERWFMYGEDIEFCTRVRRSGLSVILDGRVRVDHSVGKSTRGVDSQLSTVWLRNLYEVYCVTSSPGLIRRELWKWTVSAGFLLRSFVFAALSKLDLTRDANDQHSRKARRFWHYSRTFCSESEQWPPA